VVVGPDGTVRKTYLKVRPQGHEQTVLEDIRQMQG
jgi:peroxiredoxin